MNVVGTVPFPVNEFTFQELFDESHSREERRVCVQYINGMASSCISNTLLDVCKNSGERLTT